MAVTSQGGSLVDSVRPERLRRWVVVVGVLAITANLAIDAYNQWRSYHSAIENNSRELVNYARILAAQTESTLKTVDLLLREVADGYQQRNGVAPPSDVNALLAGRIEGLPQLLALRISDSEGTLRYRSGAAEDESGPNIADRSYFSLQRDNPRLGLFVSEPIFSRTLHRPAIVLSRRLEDSSGRFAGVVSALIDLDRIQQFYQQIKLGSRSTILLFRDDGTLVVREPPMMDRVGKAYPALVTGLSSDGATLMNSPVDGVPRFVAGAHADGFPLIVTIAREEGAVLEPWRKELFLVAAQDIVLSVLIALAIAALVHQLRRVELSERALRESEERYALAMEGANEGHFDRDIRTDTSAFMSPRMRQLLGFEPYAPLDKREEALVNVHPEDRPGMDHAYTAHLEGRTDRYEVEYRVLHPDGQWHWLQVRGRCVRDVDDVPLRLVGSAIDITERKRAEVEKDRLETQLRKSQKLEAMGTLAGGIAHDFNNILGAIVGYGEMAQRSAAEGSAVRRYIDNVMHAAGRAKALVERILAFSRSGLGERASVNVQAVIAETLDLLAASLPARVHLERKLDAGDAAVICDATQLHQVVMNLCTNAVQAMPAGGVLEVRLERAQLREPRAVFHGELQAGAYVRLTVRDSGTGIEPQVLDRMFDPFFTTKGVGAGTGLGLSLVHGIVADVGGAIDVMTVLEEGTTFIIWLPVAGSAPPPKVETDDELPLGNGEAVMVVDDEPSLVALTEEMLAQLGYEAVGFGSSAAAAKAFADDPERFDVVLTDEMMPEVTGTALAQQIRRIRSDIPIVIMSGYVDAGMTALAQSAGVSEVLRKPLKVRDIAEAIARARLALRAKALSSH
ncbi:MAG TPA: ATP-binding protein [Casimicrobiaceae bacterium]|nr:ATP-binding protein [Casimicrobiaceae bacterium]